MEGHAAWTNRLSAHVDGVLPPDEQASLATHLGECLTCAAEVRDLRRLEAVLEGFSPAPPVAFTPFWLRLRSRLPRPRAAKTPSLRPKLAFALAAAAIAVLTLASGAFAAETALPDSPLYAIKQAGEQVQLALAQSSQARANLELTFATRRLQEASAMAGVHRDDLAAQSVQRFTDLLARLGTHLPPAAQEAFQVQIQALSAWDGEGRGDGRVLSSIRQAEQQLEREEADATRDQTEQGNGHAHPTPRPHPTSPERDTD